MTTLHAAVTTQSPAPRRLAPMATFLSRYPRSAYRRLGIGVAVVSLVVAVVVQTREPADPDPAVAVENPGGIAATAGTTRLATGLQNPRGVVVLADGRLVVVEAGNGIETTDAASETGRISVFEDLDADANFDGVGEIQPVVSQIPSYNTLTEFGTGLDEVGGAGDIVSLGGGRMLITRDDPSEGYVADGSPTGINVVEFSLESGLGDNLIVRNSTMNALRLRPRLRGSLRGRERVESSDRRHPRRHDSARRRLPTTRAGSTSGSRRGCLRPDDR